jgi:hypothetical protein
MYILKLIIDSKQCYGFCMYVYLLSTMCIYVCKVENRDVLTILISNCLKKDFEDVSVSPTFL